MRYDYRGIRFPCFLRFALTRPRDEYSAHIFPSDHRQAACQASNTTQDATVFVIFGGGGDLSWRMVVPALYDLFCDQTLPAQFAIVVVDRADLTDDSLRGHLRDGVRQFSRHGMGRASSGAIWQSSTKAVTLKRGSARLATD